MKTRKFRKKPITVEAIQYTGTEDSFYDVVVFTNRELCDRGTGELFIRTLEGEMVVSKGDWVIKGVSGEFYPCKPDIFKLTYDEV